MATVEMILGKEPCQHVTLIVDIGGEKRKYVMTRAEIEKGELVKDLQYQTVVTNVKTDIALQKTDLTTAAAVVTAKEFKV